MLNSYSAEKLAEIRHREDVATAERERLARDVTNANRHALRLGHRLARLEAWLAWLGCTLWARLQEPFALRPEAACAC